MRPRQIFIFILVALLPLWALGLGQHHGQDDAVPGQSKPETRKPSLKKTITLSLNPKITQPLPNLNQGYLFNSERFRKSASTSVNDHNGQKINMESLQYNGSIIVGASRKALISYTNGKTARTATRINKTTSRANNPGTQAKSDRTSQIISLGESIGGYTVSEVEPLQVTFTRGSHTVTKDLFSTEKKRPAPTGKKIRKTTPPRAKQTTRRINKIAPPKDSAPVRK